ncbi:unnamed protein product, partial [marine sediment metagenome]
NSPNYDPIILTRCLQPDYNQKGRGVKKYQQSSKNNLLQELKNTLISR